MKFSAYCWNCPAEGKKKKEREITWMRCWWEGRGMWRGKDRNKPNSHLMTSLSIILNLFTVPRCENRISPDRNDLMAVSGLRARDHHFLLRQISSATCPHKALSKRIKASSIKSGLKKIHGKYSWHSSYPPPITKKGGKTTGQMMWPSWDRLSTVSLGWPCKKQTGSMVAALVFALRKREERALLFFSLIKKKSVFALHLFICSAG